MSKDLYVIAEQRDGNIAKVTLELLGEATILAADLKEKVYAVPSWETMLKTEHRNSSKLELTV